MAETLNAKIQLLELPKVEDARGNLSFIESGHHIPFDIKRAYWIYDVPGGEVRGSHAFRRQEEFIVALSGSFDVVLHDGVREQRIHLCRSYRGVYVPPMTWRTLDNFSTNSLGLVLSSTHYDEDDYLWDFEEFRLEKAAWQSQISAVAQAMATPPQLVATPPTPTDDRPQHYTLQDCQLLQLPATTELRRGCLTAVEGESDTVPFPIRRAFYLYDIPSGANRGQHANRQVWEFIVAASSCFSIDLDDAQSQRTVRLDRPFQGLLIPPGIWCRLHDFSSAAVVLVLTSGKYDRKDYIFDYTQFQEFRRQHK
jgi:hypothetical protein